MTSAWLVEHSVDSPHPQPLLPLVMGMYGTPCIRYALYFESTEHTRQHMETSGCEKSICSVAKILFSIFISKPGRLS